MPTTTVTPDQFSNFAVSSIAGGQGGAGASLTPTDTILLLNTNDGALFPATGPFIVVLGPGTPTSEVVKVTSRTGDTLTISRGMEGTSAAQWNVGTLVQLVITAGNMANVWSNVTSIWSHIGHLFYNVKDYGVVGDGVTDDRAAIQSVLDTIRLAGGGTAYFPFGTYLIGSTVAHPVNSAYSVGLVVGSNTMIQGEIGATLKLWTGAPNNARVLMNYNVGSLAGVYNNLSSIYTQPINHDDSIILRNIIIDGQCDAQTGTLTAQYGIDIQSASRLLLDGVRVRNMYGSAVAPSWLQSSFNYPTGESYHISFYSCYLVEVRNCEAESTSASKTSTGFRDAGCQYIAYRHCVAHGMALGPGFHTLSSSQSICEDCVSYLNVGTGASGIFAGCGFVADSNRDHVWKACIAGGRSSVQDSWPFATSTALGNGQDGFTSAGATHLLVDNCISSFNGNNGISAFGGPCDTMIVGGEFRGNGLNGMQTTGPSNCMVIKGRPIITSNGHHQINGYGLSAGCDLSGPNFSSVAPAVPTSGTVVTNNYPVSVLVIITGGTVTHVAVAEYEYNVTHAAADVATSTPAYVVLQPKDTITLTYSVAPTWQWQSLP